MAIDRVKLQARAEKLVAQGKVPQAIDQYKVLLKDQPNDLGTLNRVGDLLSRTSKISEAVQLFSRAAQLYTTGGFFLKAIAIYKKILKLDAGAIESRLRLADLYARGDFTNDARAEYIAVAEHLIGTGNDAKAREVYEKLVRIEPANVEARTALAEIYLAKGDVVKGIAELQDAAVELEKLGLAGASVDLHRRIMQVGSRDLKVVLRSIRAAIALKSYDVAIQGAKALRERFMEEAAPVEALVEALELSDRSAEAEEVAKSSLADSAGAAVPRAVLGRLHARAGRIQKAGPLLFGAARDLYREDRLSEAVRPLDLLLELEPNYPEALEQRIEIARTAGATEDLAALTARLDERTGGAGPPTPGAAGSAEPAEDKPATLQARDLSREERDYLNERTTEAEVFFKYGLYNKAIDPLLEILSRFPDHLDAHLRLKAIYTEQRNRNRLLDECIAIADLHERGGQRDEAVAILLEALNVAPDHENVRERLESLGVRQAAPPAPPAEHEVEIQVEEASTEEAQVARSATEVAAEAEEELLDLASDLGESLGDVLEAETPEAPPPTEEQSVEEVFRAFQQRVGEIVDKEDFKTHYELAIAYKEMGLIDDAIGEFEYAARDPERFIECCSNLGLCLREKGMHAEAANWYLKALESSAPDEAQTLGLRYELAETYLQMEEKVKARDMFERVAVVDGTYRDVSARLKEF